jgi:hypothetical protein
MFNDTYDLEANSLFTIPENARFPIFNEDEAKLLFRSDNIQYDTNDQNDNILGDKSSLDKITLVDDSLLPYEEPLE